MRSRGAPWLLACLVLGSAPQDQGEEVLPRYRFKKAEREEIVQTLEVDVTVERAREKRPSYSKQVVYLTEEPIEVDGAGVARIRSKCTGLQLVLTETDGSALNYDSSVAADRKRGREHPRLRPYDSMVGGVILYRVSPAGACSDFDWKDFAPGLKDLPIGPHLRDSLRQSMEQRFTSLPEKALPTGGTWKSSFPSSVDFDGQLKSDRTFTLAGVEKIGATECRRVEMKADLEFSLRGVREADLTVDGEESAGTLYFDPKAGRFIRGALSSKWRVFTHFGGLRTATSYSVSLSFERRR